MADITAESILDSLEELKAEVANLGPIKPPEVRYESQWHLGFDLFCAFCGEQNRVFIKIPMQDENSPDRCWCNACKKEFDLRLTKVKSDG